MKGRTPLSWEPWLTPRVLIRAIVVVGVLLILVGGAFAGYYYWDRYRPRGQPSPLQKAIQEAEQRVRENPSDPDLRLQLAALYFEAGLYERAAEQADQVAKAYPDNDLAWYLAGLSYVRMERKDKALPLLEKFIALREDHPLAGIDTQLQTAYYYVGETYVQRAEYEKAVEPLQGALRITPTDADARYQLAVALQHLNRCEEALEHYHWAVRLVPDFTEAYQGMAECYELLQKPAYVLYARGMVAFSQEDYETALARLQEAAEQLPDFAPVWLGLGMTYEAMGNLEDALKALEKAYSLNPEDFTIQHVYGRVQAKLEALKTQQKEGTP